MKSGITFATVLGKNKLLDKARNRMELIHLSRQGVSKQMLMRLVRYLQLSPAQMADLLPVSFKTIQRNSLYNKAVSEQILCIAEVAVKGTEVFGSQHKFIDWLNLQNRALSDYTPLSLLNSKIGIDLVLIELGRIEQGVYS